MRTHVVPRETSDKTPSLLTSLNLLELLLETFGESRVCRRRGVEELKDDLRSGQQLNMVAHRGDLLDVTLRKDGERDGRRRSALFLLLVHRFG